jgi:hypothetical protein
MYSLRLFGGLPPLGGCHTCVMIKNTQDAFSECGGDAVEVAETSSTALRSPGDGLISVPNLKWTMPTACNSIHVLPPLFAACLTEYQAKSMTDSAIGRETAAAIATDAPTAGRPYPFTLGIGFSPPFVCRESLHERCNRGDFWLAVDYPSPTIRLLGFGGT